MRKTKIICTIGPASEGEDKLKELMLAGMNVARFNFSHGTHEEQKAKFARVLRVSNELGLPVATLLDTKGPEIRLRDFEGGKAMLEAGQTFTLTTEEIMGTSEKAAISYKGLKNDVSTGSMILIDDGKIALHEEMDVLLDQYGLLKMDEATWQSIDKSWILRWKKEPWGVSALTSERRFYQENYPKMVAEKGSVDEMVYMAVKGEKV